ncbi:MAG: hypothetical protein K8S55_14135 [Phycisphaerae bacterium]|nr:hypothetical protein [Phycisphaerae bacterium]
MKYTITVTALLFTITMPVFSADPAKKDVAKTVRRKTVNEVFNRPFVRHNRNLKFQPYETPHRYLNMGSGFFIYGYNREYRTSTAAMILGCLKSPGKDLRGRHSNRNGFGRHSWGGFEMQSNEKMTINLNYRWKFSEDTLEITNEKDCLRVVQKTRFLKTTSLRAIGAMIKLPTKYWDGGRWTVGNKSGTFHKGLDKSIVLPSAKTLVFNLAGSDFSIEINLHEKVKEIVINRHDFALGNYEIYIVSEGSLAKKPRVFKAGSDYSLSYDIKTAGRFPDPLIDEKGWETRGRSWILRRPLKEFAADTRFNDERVKREIAYQILDKNSEFYGMCNTPYPKGVSGRADHFDRPVLRTRDILKQICPAYCNRKSKYYHNKEMGNRLSACLDYLSAAINRQSAQFGDIRRRGWSKAPCTLRNLPMAQAIVALARHHDVPDRKIAYWVRSYEYRWKNSDLQDALVGIKKKAIGFNAVTKIFNAARGAKFLEKNSFMPEFAKGMSVAFGINTNPVFGVKSDFSHREHHPNFFDTTYYLYMLNYICDYYRLTRGTEFEFRGKNKKTLEGILDAAIWLHDNALVTPITSDARARLLGGHHYKRAFEILRNEYPAAMTVYHQIKVRNHKTGKKAVASSKRRLPAGFKWFYNPGMLVARTDDYYCAVVAKPRIIAMCVNSWGFNAKMPMGGFYMRTMGQPRECVVPTDNAFFSGVTLVDGMQHKADADDEFMNNDGSRFVDSIQLGKDAALFGMDAVEATKAAPKDKLHFQKTYFFLKDRVITMQHVPAQKTKRKTWAYPFIMTTPHKKKVSTPRGSFDVLPDNKKHKITKLGFPKWIMLETMGIVPIQTSTPIEFCDLGAKGYRLERVGKGWTPKKDMKQLATVRIPLDPAKGGQYVIAYLPTADVEAVKKEALDGKKVKILSSGLVHALKAGNCLMVANYQSDKQVVVDSVKIKGRAFLIVKKSPTQLSVVVSAWENVKIEIPASEFAPKVSILEGSGKAEHRNGILTITTKPQVRYYQDRKPLENFKWRNKSFPVEDIIDKRKVPLQIMLERK